MKQILLNKANMQLDFKDSKISSTNKSTLKKFKKLVIEKGDDGLRAISSLLDEKELKNFKVSNSEFKNAEKKIGEAIDESLKRLKTDYIDLYQLHWPNRQSPHFGNHWPNDVIHTNVNVEQQTAEMLDILQGLATCVKAGKIRYCGLSDDTPWGINQYLKLSAEHNLPRMVSIQNEFSLLHTKDSPYLIENCVHENIAFLPWSPLATGALTGKYLNAQRPEGSRWTLTQRHGLYRDTANAEAAISAYIEIAKKHNVSPAHLALAWCDQVNGVSSTIIGATNMQQLKENIAAFKQPLPIEAIDEIKQVLQQYPMPY